MSQPLHARAVTLVGLCLAVLVAALLALPAPPAHAATFTVTADRITGDHLVDDPVPGAAPVAGCSNGIGPCSLREAVMAANTSAGPDVITFASTGTIGLGQVGAEDETTNDLDVTDDLVIQGAGITVDATFLSPRSADTRILDVDGAPLTVEGMTLVDAAVVLAAGGAVRVDNTSLHLEAVTIADSGSDADGGGIFFDGTDLTAVDSTIRGNGALRGGGISAEGFDLLRLEGTTVAGNVARMGDGGGILAGTGGDVEIVASTVRDNRAQDDGGGIAVGGASLMVADSAFTGNGTDGAAVMTTRGGAVATDELHTVDVVIDNSTFDGNAAQQSSGGLRLGATGDVVIEESAITRNRTLSSQPAGIAIVGTSDGEVRNTTISGNQVASTAPGAGGAFVSGLEVGAIGAAAHARLEFVTIAANTGPAGSTIRGLGTTDNASGVSIANSILADHDENCVAGGGPITSVGAGWTIDDDGSCGLAGAADLVTDPQLLVLGDNGGQPQGATGTVRGHTHALPAASPANGSSDPTGCPATDQRGQARPAPGPCDRGAYEGQVTGGGGGTPTANLVLTKDVAPGRVDEGGTAVFTIAVTHAGGPATAGVVVSDQVPDGLPVVSADGAGATCGTAGQLVTCDAGTMSAGDVVTIDVTVTGEVAGSHVNTATVTSATAESSTADNADDAVLTVAPTVGPGVTRIDGVTRIETAIDASQEVFDDGDAGAVVLTRADAFPDAQAGTPLAVARDAPLLLTEPATLNALTEAEIQRVLGADGEVFLLGGTTALSEAVEDRVTALGYTPVRLGGTNRFETATAIAHEGLDDPATVLVADGGDFADAVVAGAAAVAAGDDVGAVVLTSGGDLPPATSRYLLGRDDLSVTAIGAAAASAVPDAPGVVGETRFETSVAVAEAFFDGPRAVGLATGLDFADALTGGAVVGRPDVGPGPVLLTAPDALPDGVRAYLEGVAGTTGTAVIFGGTAAIDEAVAEEVAAALGL